MMSRSTQGTCMRCRPIYLARFLISLTSMPHACNTSWFHYGKLILAYNPYTHLPRQQTVTNIPAHNRSATDNVWRDVSPQTLCADDTLRLSAEQASEHAWMGGKDGASVRRSATRALLAAAENQAARETAERRKRIRRAQRPMSTRMPCVK